VTRAFSNADAGKRPASPSQRHVRGPNSRHDIRNTRSPQTARIDMYDIAQSGALSLTSALTRRHKCPRRPRSPRLTIPLAQQGWRE